MAPKMRNPGITLPSRNPALLIQPSLDLFLGVGEAAEIRERKAMLDATSGTEEAQAHPLIVVPLGLGSPYGLSLEQAEYIVNRMDSDLDSNFVTQFFEHLCLDADIRVWIEEEMGNRPEGNSPCRKPTS